MFASNAQGSLLVFAGGEGQVYQRFVVGIKEEYKHGDNKTDIHIIASINEKIRFDKYDVIVAAGVDAAKELADYDTGDAHVLYSLLPRTSYHWLQEHNKLKPLHYVIYLDQPVERYVRLVKLAMPAAKSVGYLYGDVSEAYVGELKSALKHHKLEYVDGYVSANKKLVYLLKEVMTKSDALLVLPDPYLYNRRAVQAVLLASFRSQRPLVAYSEAYVKAGALFAIHSTPEQVGMHTAELVTCILEKCKAASDREFYPKYFNVEINDSVARQLGLEIKPVAELERLLGQE